MKKLFSLVSAMLCVILLTASFSASTDAYTLYRRSMKKMDQVSSFEMKATSKAYMEMYGAEFEAAKQTMIMKVLNSPDKGVQMEAHSVDRKESPVDMYYYGGYMYRNMDGRKQKTKMDLSDAFSTTASIDWDMTQDLFEDAKVERVEDGYRIRYKTDIESAMGKSGESLRKLTEQAGLPSGMRISLSDVNSSLTIGDDDLQKAFAMTFVITVTSDDQSLKMRYNASGKITAVNSVKTINYPADLASYVKVKSF